MTTGATTVISSIFAAASAAMAAQVVVADSGAPDQFIEADGEIEASEDDRAFAIVDMPEAGDNTDYVNIPGTEKRWLQFAVDVQYVNEGRTMSASTALIHEDAKRVQDRIFGAFYNGAVVGVDSIRMIGAYSIRTLEEKTRKILTVPFRVDYVVAVATS